MTKNVKLRFPNIAFRFAGVLERAHLPETRRAASEQAADVKLQSEILIFTVITESGGPSE